MHRFQLIAVLLVLTVLLSGCLKPGLRGVVPYRAEMDEAGRGNQKHRIAVIEKPVFR